MPPVQTSYMPFTSVAPPTSTPALNLPFHWATHARLTTQPSFDLLVSLAKFEELRRPIRDVTQLCLLILRRQTTQLEGCPLEKILKSFISPPP